jgi:tetratricopeptide (TPR) repeat protein
MEGNAEALRRFYKALELDPNFASAYGRAANCFVFRKTRGWVMDREQETAEAVRLAQRAIQLGQDDAAALSMAGWVLARMAGELDAGAGLIDRALLLNPNLASAWHSSGITRCFLGEPDIAIEHFARAIRLDPLGPYVFWPQMGTGLGHFLAGRYDEAYLWAKKVLDHRPNVEAAMRLFAVSGALSGRLEEAQKIMRHVLQLDPTLRVSNLKDVYPFRRPKDLASVIEGFRKAGMPE